MLGKMPNSHLVKTMSLTSLPNILLVAIALLVLSFSKLCFTAFVSIDCGSSGSSIDTNNIIWTGDYSYAPGGESHRIPFTPEILSTLRAFPDGKENCYSIPVQNGEKVLSRATFLYGNYDNKASPPVFDLYFDGHFWDTVSTSSESYTEYEAIYVTRGNSTNICVTQTMANQIPFISSLEVRSLKSTMYSQVDPNNAFITLGRIALGANQDVRYPHDPYDRIWRAQPGSGLLSNVKSEALDIDISMLQDSPPKAVMQHAVTTPSTSYQIAYSVSLPRENVPLLINAYFSEVTKDATAARRSMEIYVDNKFVYGPLIPLFGSVEEVYIKKSITSDTSIVIKPLLTSTLPPILNALEFYQIRTLNVT